MKHDYYLIENLYSYDECIDLNQKILQNTIKDINDRPAYGVKKTSSINHFHRGALREELRKFTNCILDINKNSYGFDIHQFNDYEPINYNVYDGRNLSEYGWHKDNTFSDVFDIKLTAILNTSQEEYEGGELQLFLNDITPITKLKTGCMIIFYSAISHRITPVSKGTRTSISQWITGPTWK
jgi:predicted 2-oxoglutarate/Fe(II)-dependent dioxygenase YbiX